jgi:hypothetical protein
MIEVEMGEHDHIDVIRRKPQLGKALQEDVLLLLDPVALAQGRLEKRADPRFQQHRSSTVLAYEKATAGQRDPVLLVGWEPT